MALFGLFKKKPAARIKIGSTFLGDKISATAEGYVIYKEYDQEDRQYYYWEEWELRGFNDYDSWIEYDHYTRKITLYEPLKPKEFIDPATLAKGQSIQFTTRRGEVVDAHVTELGVGTVARREGTLTYHVFAGDKVAYAECRGPNGLYSIEKYNDKELDIYKGTVLSRSQQKKLLGRIIAPGLWGLYRSQSLSAKLYTILFIGVMGLSFGAEAIPQYETYCTPRTVTRQARPLTVQPYSPTLSPTPSISPTPPTYTAPPASPTDEVVSQDTSQTCYRRRVTGGGGGGGGK